MSRSRVLAVLVLVVVAAGLVAVVVLRRTPGEADAPPWPSVDAPAATVDAPASAPSGPPLVVGPVASPDLARWSGTFAYDEVPSGRFGTERPKRRRSLRGTFTAEETTSGPPARRATSVDVRLALDDRVGSEAETRRPVSARLAFERDAASRIVHRSIRLEAPRDVQTELELLQAAFVQRFGVPSSASVRRGERLPIEDAIDVDDLFHRPALFLFKERAILEGAVTVPVEGGVWVDARGPADALVLRAALVQRRTGENGPKGAGAVTIEYLGRLDAEREIALADGRVRRHAATLSRRIRYAASGLDYTILVRARVTMDAASGR